MFQILPTPQSPSLNCHCLLGSHKRISLPTLQSLCPSGAHICLSWMVPVPLQHCNQSSGSSTRAACRVITGCLSSTPSSLLLLEAQLPPLKLTLEHQTLHSFERALRLPPDFSSLYALAIKNVPCRLKKKPSWRSFCSSATLPLPSPRESLITCPPFHHGPQSISLFPPSFPTAQAAVQPDSKLLQTDYPPSPPLISKYGLTVLSPPFSVLVALESMLHAPNATHPIPYPFPLVQLPPASQPKPSPSSKVLLGVLAISWPANSSQFFS